MTAKSILSKIFLKNQENFTQTYEDLLIQIELRLKIENKSINLRQQAIAVFELINNDNLYNNLLEQIQLRLDLEEKLNMQQLHNFTQYNVYIGQN